MELWTSLLDILILLGAAMLLGGLCERIKQSPLVGYLLAGVLLGPNALNVLPSYESVYTIAELGVALLLFTIGLEFSWRRLLSVGRVAGGGGTLQVLITGLLAALLCRLAGVDTRAAIALGAMVAVSSTAAVVRVLASRAEIDTVHGRNALGILLLQDMALVPLALLVAALSVGGGVMQVGWAMLRAVGLASVLAAALFLVVSYALPRLLSTQTAVRNRDFSILLAIVTVTGASWLSHALGFSPVLGAFVAGMVLAESPFATQIRADIVPLQTLFVTLFFSSIGMFSNPAWVAEHWAVLAGAVAVIVIGKTVVTAGAVRLVGGQPGQAGQALATGVVLAQIGEFSLVLAVVARDGGVIAADHFDLAVAALIVTLFLTPYLAALAPRLAMAVTWRRALASVTAEHPAVAEEPRGHIVLVGFGPAGQRVAETLMAEAGPPILVVDLNTANLGLAESYGLTTTVGDIRREEVLERMHVHAAVAIVVTVPDPGTSRQIIQRVRAYAPDALVVVRSRYHVHRWQLEVAGAHAVVDEEDEVGARVAMEVRRVLRECGLLPSE